MNAQEDTFISHLVELRDRLLRAVAAVIVVFVCLMPWAGDIYDILAHPMMQALPDGISAGDLAAGLAVPPSTLSAHLAILAGAGLAGGRYAAGGVRRAVAPRRQPLGRQP